MREEQGETPQEPAGLVQGSDSDLADSFLQDVARLGGAADEPVRPRRFERLGGDDRFEILDEIGAGSMGRIFSAWDRKRDRLTAIKFLHCRALSREQLSEQLRVEALSTARLHHENIIRIFETGAWNHAPFLVMEYLEGEGLNVLLKRQRIGLERATYILAQVAAALAHAHQQGIIHRDLKPSNVFVLRSGAIKLLDFGLARSTDAIELSDIAPQLSISGTPAYMAPEQWRGERQDARTDIWAAGILYYQMVAGHHPYRRANLEQLRALVTSPAPMPSLPARLRQIAPEAAQLVARALQKDPARRFSSATALREALSIREANAVDNQGPFVDGDSRHASIRLAES